MASIEPRRAVSSLLVLFALVVLGGCPGMDPAGDGDPDAWQETGYAPLFDRPTGGGGGGGGVPPVPVIPRVAMDGDGNALAVWVKKGKLYQSEEAQRVIRLLVVVPPQQ